MESDAEILLIDDNLQDAEMTIRSLKKNNITNKIFHLKDGEEALHFFFDTPSLERPHRSLKVILLDIKMPKINGIEVLEKIKSHEETKRIPVVMLTSSKEDPDIEKCYLLGANSYIVKPIDSESFNRVISELGLYWVHNNHAPV